MIFARKKRHDISQNPPTQTMFSNEQCIHMCRLSISVFLIREAANNRTQARGSVIAFDMGKQNQ